LSASNKFRFLVAIHNWSAPFHFDVFLASIRATGRETLQCGGLRVHI
jgi:hypothetical protein